MSSRARRLIDGAHVSRFEWHRTSGADGVEAAPASLFEVVRSPGESIAETPPGPAAAATPTADVESQLAAIEREAFAKGYAAGERAGVEAGARRTDAMLRRMAQTIEDIGGLRREMVRQTERQMVQLAVLLARRVVTRELSLDVELVAAIAHVALERLGDQTPATIRLNAGDYAAIASLRGEAWEGGQVTIAPDPALPRGGCIVESEFGRIDAGVEAQLDELSQTLLGPSMAATTTPGSDDGHA